MMREFLQVLEREVRSIFTDSTLRNIVLIAPIIYALLVSAVYIRHTLFEIPIAVAQLDNSQPARTLIRMLNSSPKLEVTHQAVSVAEIRELMLRGEVRAAIVIPADFSRRLKRGRDTTVTTFINTVSMVEANMVTSASTQVIQTFSAGVEIKSLMKHGENSRTAYEKFMPVKLDTRPLFNPSYNYTNFLVPGLLMTVIQQVALLAMALSWAGERERGTLADLFRLSRSPVALMAGKALPYVFINFLVAELYFRVLFPMAGIPIEGNWGAMLTFTTLFVAAIVFWGMWFSAFCRTRLMATQMLMFIALPSFILSGYTWPLAAMPDAIRFLSHLLPITYFVTGVRDIYLGGVPAAYLWHSFLALGIFLAVNVGLAWLGVRNLLQKVPPDPTPHHEEPEPAPEATSTAGC